MNTNKGLQHQQQKQSGGHNPFKPSPSRSHSRSRITRRRSSSRSRSRTGSNHPLQNPAELRKIMALLQ